MEPNKPKTSAKDFFLNLGVIVALYTVVISLVNLLFTIINTAYPQINYGYYGSQNISWPVATLIIFLPIFILLSWLLEKQYLMEPERKNSTIRKWLTYITLFIAGLVLAGDLITVLYYFIDGQELTVGFLLKVLSVLVVTLGVFMYYISDIRGKLNSNSRKIWTGATVLVILATIVWGFSVLGSPATQRQYKYDEQKVNGLSEINNQITNYYATKGLLPKTLSEVADGNYYVPQLDPQSQKSYEYEKTGNITYNLCAEFNKASNEEEKMTAPRLSYPQYGGVISWNHPAGHYCFNETINSSQYPPMKL